MKIYKIQRLFVFREAIKGVFVPGPSNICKLLCLIIKESLKLNEWYS